MRQFYREFSQVNTSYILRNPAHIDSSARYSFSLGYNSFNKLSQNLKNIYFIGTIRINSSEKKVRHYLGLNLVSFQEGKYIHQERPHLRYGQIFRVGEYAYISTGISLGLLSHVINANDVIGGEANYVPDGTIGIKYMYKNLYGGFSASQLFQASFEKYDKPAKMIRMYYLNGGHKFYLDAMQRYSLETTLILKSPDEFKTTTSWWYLNLGLNEFFEANVLVNDLQSINFGFGLPKLKIDNHEFGISFSYLSSFVDKRYQNIGNVEVGLKYKIN